MEGQVLIPVKPRKVWVYNDWHQDYVEDFRGSPITIPAKGRKLMNLLEAERFIGQAKPLAKFLLDGKTLAKDSVLPKMLRLVELNDDELMDVEGKTRKDLAKEDKAEEKALSSACAICGGVFANKDGLKIHVARKHPDYQAVEAA